MLLVRNHPGRFGLAKPFFVSASIVVSFAIMLLAVPIIHRLGLRSWVVCPFRALTGLPCPTCGYTRFFDLASSGNLLAAIVFQPFLLLIVVFSAVAAVMAAASLSRRRELVLPQFVLRAIWISLAASWIWNLYFNV